jgi:hypothetical protein
MTISTTELCQLIERPYAWFESKRRRNRAEAELKKIDSQSDWQNVDSEKLDLPVKDIFGGAWAKYDSADALNMMVACALEESVGLTFLAGSRMATNCGAVEALSRENEPDLFIARLRMIDGSFHHTSGSIAELRVIEDTWRPFAMTVINVSHLLRVLQHRAEVLGLSERLRSDAASSEEKNP